MTPETELLVRILDAFRDSLTLHDLSYQLGTGLPFAEAGDIHRLQDIMEEHCALIVDVEQAIKDALFERRGAA